LRLKILSTNSIILLATLFYPLLVKHVSLSRVSFPCYQREHRASAGVVYLTARLDKTVLSEKMIEEDLSRVEESATKTTYRLRVGFERCEKSAPIFVHSSS
jgi:hypothetical protein